MMSYKCFQALCAISLVRNHCMLMLSMLFDNNDNDNDLFLFLYRNCTFDLLEDGWCYHHTCFTVAQLHELYSLLQLPVMFTISTVGHKVSSEEAFIITITKLDTGRTNTSLMEVFGIVTDTFISRVYKYTLEVLNNKAEGILHGNCLQHWVHLFPEFAEAIKNKLNRPQYGGLLFEKCSDCWLFGLQS